MPKKPAAAKAKQPAMLPMSEGDAGVRAYIASMEPWQAAIARRVDALVAQHVPGVRKAVKWHTPLYGARGRGFFLAFKGFHYHVNVTFFRGTSLTPVPPGGKQKHARYLQVRQSAPLDEQRLATWIKQAASIPGWVPGRPL